MRVRVVLQSRLSSSRLPGKAMLTVAGRPMVVLAAQRAGASGAPGSEVVVATSDRPEDDVIASTVADAGIGVVRGPLDDPLRRFVIAAEGLDDTDAVVRLTADNVVPDGALVDLLVLALTDGSSYARVGGDDPAVPYGVAGEAFTVAALREADARASSAHEREHVTPLMRETYGDHRIAVPDPEAAWAGLRCTVDTFDDYVALAHVFAGIDDPAGVGWRVLCDRFADLATVAPAWTVRGENPVSQGPLVIGTVQLGVSYGAANATGLPDASTAGAVLAAAAAERITHLDTARAYGESEARIGVSLGRGLSEHIGIVTKIAPLDQLDEDSPAGWGRDAVTASVQRSLRELGVQSVDGLLLHRAADWSRPGVRDALATLREEGLARVVGGSLSTPGELVELLADPACGYVQVPFNILDRRWLADEVQAALAARPDVVVTCRSAYLQGLLVSADARWPANAGVAPGTVREAVAELVRELGRESPADLCLAYVLGHDWVTSVVVGAETPAQVHDSAGLARQTPLTADQIGRVHQVLPAGSDDLVDPSRWRQG